MAVIINELEHVAEAPESRSRGDGRGGGSGGNGGESSESGPAGMIRALRREASRRARLWAD